MRLLKVGRDPHSDIVLQSDKASALHAEITVLNNGDILLEDKNSRNGTFVMNRRIQPGTQVSVKRGDAIRFGDVELLWNQVPLPEDLSNYKAVYGIGTSMRNDIQVNGNTASRYHATLKIDKKGKAFIQDHSKNGTTVNGDRIGNGQTRQIKKGDAVAVGGVPINLNQYIPSNPWPRILMAGGAAVVIAICVIALVKFIKWDNKVPPVTTQALENASACVYGGFLYEIDVKDDPFKTKLNGWPDKWYAGYDNHGKLAVSMNAEELNPIGYTGTAFFISSEGEMGTNRHVAVPWKYIEPEDEETIRQQLKVTREQLTRIGYSLEDSGFLTQLAFNYANAGYISYADALAWLNRFKESDIQIEGRHNFFGVGLTGTKINSILDIQQAQVIADSDDPKKDVALIRLNSRKTPEHLVKLGAIYDIEQARLDERTLKPQDDELIITGYPYGEVIGTKLFDGKELRPTMHKAYLSKVPDDNQMQIQTVGMGGLSGSPVIDQNHRLVGVLYGGFSGSEVTYICNIKHLKEIYDKNRARE